MAILREADDCLIVCARARAIDPKGTEASVPTVNLRRETFLFSLFVVFHNRDLYPAPRDLWFLILCLKNDRLWLWKLRPYAAQAATLERKTPKNYFLHASLSFENIRERWQKNFAEMRVEPKLKLISCDEPWSISTQGHQASCRSFQVLGLRLQDRMS